MASWWFSPGTTFTSINKTEVLLNVALNTITQTLVDDSKSDLHFDSLQIIYYRYIFVYLIFIKIKFSVAIEIKS